MNGINLDNVMCPYWNEARKTLNAMLEAAADGQVYTLGAPDGTDTDGHVGVLVARVDWKDKPSAVEFWAFEDFDALLDDVRYMPNEYRVATEQEMMKYYVDSCAGYTLLKVKPGKRDKFDHVTYTTEAVGNIGGWSRYGE